MAKEIKKEDEGWEEVVSDMGKIIRWTETAKSDKEAEKTIYIGDTVHGVYDGKRENIGENDANLYMIKTVGDGMLSIWGTTVLDDLMKRIYEGNEVKITYTGSQKPKAGGKAYSLFKVVQRPASDEILKALGEVRKEEESIEDVDFE